MISLLECNQTLNATLLPYYVRVLT